MIQVEIFEALLLYPGRKKDISIVTLSSSRFPFILFLHPLT